MEPRDMDSVPENNVPEPIKQLILIANDIYTSLGAGYNEVIYHRAFEVALRLQGINYQSEVITPVLYKGFSVGHSRVDLIINGIIIEFKALNYLNNDAVIQIKNYMKHYNSNQGLIINFNQKNNKLDIRFIYNEMIFTFENGTFILNGTS